MKYILLQIIALMLIGCGAQGQVMIEGFEHWQDPDGNAYLAGWSRGAGSGATPDAYRGNHALTVWTWYCSSLGGVILGDNKKESSAYVCEDYTFNCYGDYGVPIEFKPNVMTGYYRYVPGQVAPGSIDSGVIRILLKRHNPALGRYDTVGIATHRLGPADVYTPFTVTIEDRIPGVIPDSIAVAIISGEKGSCDCLVGGNCYYFTLDDLRFSNTASGVSHSASEIFGQTRVYPNPARAETRIEWKSDLMQPHRLHIFSTSGELVRTVDDITGRNYTLHTAGLSSGEYLFELHGGGEEITARGRFIVE